ncbi:hypothetical protein Amuc02_23100 [Akkermansia muciniphila]|nr:hypothetical protein Amuc02_23100 [Akkermansia muciniphila]
MSAVAEEGIQIPSTLFSDGIAIDPPAVFWVVIAVIVINQGEIIVVHLAGPLDGLDEVSRGSCLSIGGVVVSRRDTSISIEHLCHILVEVHAVAVKGSVLREGQGAGGCRFQRIPQQCPKHIPVVQHILRR